MPASSAVERLLNLNDETELWWDSSPLIYEAWQQEQRLRWQGQPEYLQALDGLGAFDSGRAIRGSTTNPPITWQAIEADRAFWESYLEAVAPEDPQERLWTLYGEVIRRGARLLEPVYRQTNGAYGHICGQVDPRDVIALDPMLTQAYRLHALNRNVMIKMPATAEGIEGIRILSAEGISTTATLCFSVAQLVAVAEAAQSGYEQARQHGIDLTGCRSCAALMMGRMEEAPAFQEQAEESGVTLDDAHLRWAGVAVAREAYRIYQERGYETRLLLASMRLGPEVDGSTRIWHLEQVAGGALVLTLFPNILAAFIEAYADQPLEPRIEEPVPPEVLSTLMEVPYFRQAYEEDALAPEQFNDLPGVRITAAGFVEAMETIDAFANR